MSFNSNLNGFIIIYYSLLFSFCRCRSRFRRWQKLRELQELGAGPFNNNWIHLSPPSSHARSLYKEQRRELFFLTPRPPLSANNNSLADGPKLDCDVNGFLLFSPLDSFFRRPLPWQEWREKDFYLIKIQILCCREFRCLEKDFAGKRHDSSEEDILAESRTALEP